MAALLFKASVVIIVLLVFYKLFLERESFFSANRLYLLSCLVFASATPFIVLPELVEHQGVLSSFLHPNDTEVPFTIETTPSDIAPSNTNIPSNSPTVSTEIPDTTITIAIEQMPVKTYVETPTTRRGIGFWLLGIYLFGVGILLLNLLGQTIGVFWKVWRSHDKIEDDNYVIVNMNTESEPCSFFHYIFINPASYDYDTYEQILAHEKIHVQQKHSVDLLITELAVALLWFNPFVWLLRKEVEKNLEYQTDQLLLNDTSTEKERYQMNLVKVASHTHPLAITTNYNQSLIKQRILKMNAKKSNAFSYWKYAFVAPVLFGLLLLLNEPLLIAAEADTIGMTMPAEQAEPAEERILPERPIITRAPLLTPEQDNESTIVNNCAKLTKAVRENDLEKIKSLLKTIDPNCIDPDPGFEVKIIAGCRFFEEHAAMPLHAAARQGLKGAADLLLAAGAQLEAYAEGDGTPAFAAAAHGQLEFLQFLEAKGASLTRVFPNHGNLLTTAANEGHNQIVDFLLGKGLDVDASFPNQGTPLIAAANNGHTSTVKLLLNKGAVVDAQSPNQGSALIAAANNGHLETVKLLLDRGADINQRSPNQGNALVAAANNGHAQTVAYLLDKSTNPLRKNALAAAANNGHTETVKLLIGDHDYQVDVQIARNEEPIKELELEMGTLEEEADILELLAEGNVHIDISDGRSSHGLGMINAANNGHTETVEYFLEQGVPIDFRTPDQGTALIAAANNGHTATCEYLLDAGAKVNLATPNQGTALIAAANNGHNRTLAFLLEEGAKIDQIATNQGTALIAAANNGHIKTVKLLLTRGASINQIAVNQGTALIAAANNGHLQVVQFLVNEGAKYQLRVNGRTAFNEAANNGHRNVVNYLMSLGAQ